MLPNTFPKLDAHKAAVLTNALQGQIPYGWAHKVKNSVSLTEFILLCHAHGVDCSGFICWLLYQISSGAINISMGSWEIKDCFAKLLPVVPYANAGKMDGVLRICGFPPVGPEAGHVWTVKDKLTMESHGKNRHGNGIDRRPWDTPVLLKATWCYELTAPLAAQATYTGLKAFDADSGALLFECLDRFITLDKDPQTRRVIARVGKAVVR